MGLMMMRPAADAIHVERKLVTVDPIRSVLAPAECGVGHRLTLLEGEPSGPLRR